MAAYKPGAFVHQKYYTPFQKTFLKWIPCSKSGAPKSLPRWAAHNCIHVRIVWENHWITQVVSLTCHTRIFRAGLMNQSIPPVPIPSPPATLGHLFRFSRPCQVACFIPGVDKMWTTLSGPPSGPPFGPLLDPWNFPLKTKNYKKIK